MEMAIGLLAPPICLGCSQEGRGVCQACTASEMLPRGERCWRCGALSPACRTCRSCQSFGGPRYVWIVTDYAGLARQALGAYKFKHQRFLADDLAGLMSETFLAFNDDQALESSNYLIIPLPTASRRLRQRSFDHTALLARRIAQQTGLESQKRLGRLGGSSQVGSRRMDRLKQLEGQFFVSQPGKIRGRNILIIDDVITTGASLRAATKTLRAAGAKHVDALVFAKRL